MFHWLAHLLGLNYGTVYTWWDKEDLMVGFKCTKCGDISGVHKALVDVDICIKKGDK